MSAENISLAQRILACVELIPVGRVMSYGDVAEYVGTRAARNVGRVLARDGGTVPWHRVLRSDGTCAEHIRVEQLARLAAEGVPIRGERVDLAAARWDGRQLGV
ncbi:MGMT family protein [Jatrophihabitans lederbergiae]|uniref:MGMT family protein n=1 Tax=Jatrophihabitans lederbergiae TaxID=3075547 RepID=A0ABU2J7E7_9ACTN|nr:MGMT family protein [Jatrophihabitans sp. DSM 44399]MDT0260544.1 MGMT family protein [Jatrophihabitans sp. DSM 44399]